ncbi:hypothetical protein AJ78_01258 [Emergomyces pasteurianus Ep9510]|uniref:Ndc10 domain-containing protein n=1 Tax=Emergomyces pasteurianus Ep9510 TaxID=1447872 RepID=A0A1J9PQK7_9EURO|nr:hypothetical protein AJ78_01258 [Emergomyces pasteurianus Ep9510]
MDHQQLQIDQQLFSYREQAPINALENRPKNSNKQYLSKQKEWRNFCTKIGFTDGELVTEPKLVRFLNEEVLHRPSRSSHKSRRDGKYVIQTLGRSAVKQYIAAVVDLYKSQRSRGLNSSPHPRGSLVTSILHSHDIKETIRKRMEYRGANTQQDGYDEKMMIRLMKFCWTGWYKNDQTSVLSHLRTGLSFLMNHSMLLRGETSRTAQLPDLFTIQLSNEGPAPCWPMILITDNGKTNQLGRLEYAAVIRHKNPLLCTISHLAFYLFYRWNIVQESPPNFQRRSLWYDIHILCGQNPLKPLAYDTQLQWTNRMYAAAGILKSKKTHLGRSQRSRYAELNEVSEGRIRRAGQWNNDALTNCYLTNISREFVRAMAGFDPSTQGNYFLPRAAIRPPEQLEAAVWPWVDVWLHRFDSYEHNEGGEIDERMKSDLEDEQDLAAQGFLRLLKQLRTVILQDSVLLQREFPDHPLWSDPLFVREDYKAYAIEVARAVETVVKPQEIQIQRDMIADQLQNIRQEMLQRIDKWGHECQQLQQKMTQQISDLINGHVAFSVRAVPQNSMIELTTASASSPRDIVRSSMEPESNVPESADMTAVLLTSSSKKNSYTHSRTIQSVPDLWREWTTGLDGGPSVRSLEDQGGQWRKSSPKEQMMFSRRKVIIDEIYKRESSGMSIDAAVQSIELIRQRGRLSLNSLIKLLKRERQG